MATRVAGELYETITGQLFEIGRQLRQQNGYPFDPEQLKIALQNAIEGKFGKQKLAKKPKAVKQLALLTIVAVTNTTSGPIAALASTQDARFVAWAASVLGVSSDTPIETLSKRLIAGKHTITDEEALDMAKRTDKGEPTGLKTDGHANFYFKVNDGGGVSVGGVLHNGQWCPSEYSLADDFVWKTGRRCLLVRNLVL